MIFGNGKKGGGKKVVEKLLNKFKNKPSNNRPAFSYRRPVPTKEDITDTKEYPLNQCPECKGHLSNIKK
jgi:hypothetical protein